MALLHNHLLLANAAARKAPEAVPEEVLAMVESAIQNQVLSLCPLSAFIFAPNTVFYIE